MGRAGVGSKLCRLHGCAKGNRVVSFENKSSGNLRFPGQPRVFSVGWCPCFLTLVAQGGGGGGRKRKWVMALGKGPAGDGKCGWSGD